MGLLKHLILQLHLNQVKNPAFMSNWRTVAEDAFLMDQLTDFVLGLSIIKFNLIHLSQHYRSLLSVSEDNVGETKRRYRCFATVPSRHSNQHYRSLLSVSEDNVGETKRRYRYFATVPPTDYSAYEIISL